MTEKDSITKEHGIGPNLVYFARIGCQTGYVRSCVLRKVTRFRNNYHSNLHSTGIV